MRHKKVIKRVLHVTNLPAKGPPRSCLLWWYFANRCEQKLIRRPSGIQISSRSKITSKRILNRILSSQCHQTLCWWGNAGLRTAKSCPRTHSCMPLRMADPQKGASRSQKKKKTLGPGLFDPKIQLGPVEAVSWPWSDYAMLKITTEVIGVCVRAPFVQMPSDACQDCLLVMRACL